MRSVAAAGTLVWNDTSNATLLTEKWSGYAQGVTICCQISCAPPEITEIDEI